MPTLSVIMIVKNEEHCLGRCLDSVRAIADEIVVADTGSTDATVAVAERFGAKTLFVPWEDDFAKARNAGMAAASGEWLLHLDADEALDPEGARRIRSLVDADGAGADAIEVTLANYCNEPRAWRWVRCAPDDPYARGFAGYIAAGLLRLFRNGRGYEYREPVHENITESVRERGGIVRAAPILIHHYGYQPEESRRGEKARRYLAIARRKVEQCPRDAKAQHDFAEQALACGFEAESEAACRRALENDADHLPAVTTLANILLFQGRLDEAAEVLRSFEAKGIAPPHLVAALAAVALRQGRNDEARRRLEAVRAAAPDTIMARGLLARVYGLAGEDAAECAEIAWLHAAAPGLEECQRLSRALDLRRQGEAAAAAGRYVEALRLLAESLKNEPEDPRAHNALGVVLYQLGEPGKARTSFERALRLAPGYTDARENLAGISGESR